MSLRLRPLQQSLLNSLRHASTITLLVERLRELPTQPNDNLHVPVSLPNGSNLMYPLLAEFAQCLKTAALTNANLLKELSEINEAAYHSSRVTLLHAENKTKKLVIMEKNKIMVMARGHL